MHHGLILVLLDVGIIRVAIRRERGLYPLFEDLLNGTERRFGAGNAQPPIETRNVVGYGEIKVFPGVRGLKRRQRPGYKTMVIRA